MKKSDQANYLPALSFDFLTPVYDPVVRWTTREKEFKQKLIEQVAAHAKGEERKGNLRILDLACGTATLTIALKQNQANAEIFALDADEKILRIARFKAGKAKAEIVFERGLSFEMPYHGGFFDAVVTSLFFHHLSGENKLKTLYEIRRVLKPGGSLHIADWGKPDNFLMKIASLPVQWLDGATTEDSFRGILPNLLAEAGFTKVVETARFNTAFGTIRFHHAEKNR